MRLHLFAFLMKINIIFTFHNGNYMECNENWLWYMLNGEFVWKCMGNKGFTFCEKWFIIHISYSIQWADACKPSESYPLNQFPDLSVFVLLSYDIESRKKSSAQQQFNFTVDDLYFVPWLARNWTNSKCLMSRGDCIKRVIVEKRKKNPENRSNFLPYFF